MSPSCHHDVTIKNDDDSMMTPETIENKEFKASCHHVTIKSSPGGECVPMTDDDHDGVLDKKSEDHPVFNPGDPVSYLMSGEVMTAVVKQVKTVSDKGKPLFTPMAELDNGFSISISRLSLITNQL